jgi:TonB-dependent receptor
MIAGIYSIRSKIASLIILLLFLTAQSFTFAQSGSIRGEIFDKDSKDPLTGANVIVKGTSLGAASDLDGKFIIRNVPVGNHKLIISYIGYNSDSSEINFTANHTIEETFYLILNVVEGQTVVVTSQAQGQIQAINQQLTSDNIANIVSEAKIQELPDFNAASALSRLPGISTTQSSGEDNKVVIRGLAPKYNAIEIDGIRLSATGSSNIGLTSDVYVTTPGVSNDRSVDLTMLSPYMIRMISVYKSLTPDMNANSIGGTVNMELREAPSGLHTDLLWQSGYTAKSNTYGNYRAVASGSDRFFDDKLGVYALLNIESYDRNSDNLNANYEIAGDQSEIDPATGYRPVKVGSVTFSRHIETRKRYGGNLILDYALPHGSIKFVNLLAQINSDYRDNNQTINYDDGTMAWRLSLGKNIIDQRMHSLKFNYDLGFLTADLSANYSSSSNKLHSSPVINFNQTNALQGGVERNNKIPEDLTYLLTNFKGDSAVVLRSANLFSNDYKDDKYTYKADFQAPFNIGTVASGFFKFGGQYNKQSISTNQEAPYLGFNGSATDPNATGIQTNLMRAIYNQFGIAADAAGNLTGVSFKTTDNSLFSSFLDNKFGSIYYAASPDLLNNILGFIIGNPSFDASNRQESTGAAGGWYDGPYQQLTNDYEYHEKYYATYGMAKINFLNFMVIGGVRYEKVHSDYFAYNARDQRNAQSQIMYDTTSVTENEFALPMAQIKYSPLDWMDIRYAYTQTLARPDYSSISPKFTITQGNPGFIYAGNPELKPAKAFNHDVNITFHSNQIGLFTLGGFYKTIDNFVYTASYDLDAAQNAGIDNISRYTIVRNGANVVIPNAKARVIRPVNNPFEATVKGIEFDFQHNFWYLPAPFNYIVISINYARIYSSATYPFYVTKPIPGTRPPQSTLIDSSSSGRLIDQPNHVFNASIGYDYEGFSSRLSFLFRSNTATLNGGQYPENDSYSKDYFRIDFSARQKLPWWNSELFLDVSNLNNANTSGIQKSTQGFQNIQNYGLTGNLGIRIRY